MSSLGFHQQSRDVTRDHILAYWGGGGGGGGGRGGANGINGELLKGFTTGWAKSQFTYVGLNSPVTEWLIEIILSGMTYYHHWFEELVKSKNICV